MKENNDIESYLRQHRPIVDDDPTFLLKVQQRMRAVEGIKQEVDRQRKHHNKLMAYTLIIGAISSATLLTLLNIYPINHDINTQQFITKVCIAIEPWRHYLMAAVVACTIGATFLLDRKGSGI